MIGGANEAIGNAVAGLQLIEHELLLFAAFWFILGALDDLGVDACWIWLKLTGRTQEPRVTTEAAGAALQGRAAVLIAAWKESGVIGHTVRHALAAWTQQDYTIYVGCYCNDKETIAAVMAEAGSDLRVRVVIHDRPGPTTKADCLNRIHAALCADEQRHGFRYRLVVLHDAEDMVHRAELAVLDAGLNHADFLQLPVRPEPQPQSPWVAGHYSDEFTEAHAKVLVVRDALGAAMPAAGVGCGFSRETIARIAKLRLAQGGAGPFASECLTEDYELGVLVWRQGGKSRFLRVRDDEGQLVATRAYFPARLDDAVRQKTRWIHGIAFQGWDRLGWGRGLADLWMALRDRRGPLTAIVLTSGYALIVVEGLLALANILGFVGQRPMAPELRAMLVFCFASFLWRCINRFAFTTHEYGLAEGFCSILRIPVANLIAITAGRRALVGYIRTLSGAAVRWDKTEHTEHPATLARGGALSL
ncbi:bacteriophage N4 adsorption protein B [Novosphingobium sp. Rr 2-17]|uniref:glycosyl transferase family protein n=1 Tax=Novosphingobium sp. Rr 2-17 TaxID=555793 RepID=UPI00026988A2|nr:glycosyl transferase family protein [Novosphingobium sp. Rr 2-17]EIZ78598.1 bacteriophage N4 adsorption protein B [Novosphingobium sp. Rr 2-17]